MTITNQWDQPLDEELPKEFKLSRSRIMYIEDKSGGLEGPARIGRVYFSKTRKTLYYRGKRFSRLGGGYKANHFDVETGDEYWISGPHKDRNDGLYGGDNGAIIDDDVCDEYWDFIDEPQQKKGPPLQNIVRNLVINPNEGIGDIKLNATKENIEELLGKPEGIYEQQDNGERTVDWQYPSIGIEVSLEPSMGFKVTAISSNSPKTIFLGLRPIGMKIEDLRASIPNIKNDGKGQSSDWFVYDKKMVLFEVIDGSVIEISVLLPETNS